LAGDLFRLQPFTLLRLRLEDVDRTGQRPDFVAPVGIRDRNAVIAVGEPCDQPRQLLQRAAERCDDGIEDADDDQHGGDASPDLDQGLLTQLAVDPCRLQTQDVFADLGRLTGRTALDLLHHLDEAAPRLQVAVPRHDLGFGIAHEARQVIGIAGRRLDDLRHLLEVEVEKRDRRRPRL
jgi:hypothetical protein